MTTVYFGTNRKKDGTGEFGFGASSVPNDPTAATYAVAEVSSVTLADADAGAIQSIHDTNAGDFSQTVNDKIIGAGRNLLIFIHGADNSFEDAIKRAAFNREWFAASGEAAADTTVVAFTWPSSNEFFSPGHTPLEEYKKDQVQAEKSHFHLALFLKKIYNLRGDFLRALSAGRVFLLAHSMGNWALQGAIQGWFDDHGPSDRIFDHVILAAPDEVRDTFEMPHGGRLANLPKLSGRISVYYSRADILMIVSEAANHNVRLGYNGPEHKFDAGIYPPAEFRLVDCSDVLDYLRLGESSHQYYRKSPTVRADIVANMVNDPPPDGGNIVLSTPPAGPDLGAIA
jgi:esterase/lipase superfamily enzyme